MGARDVDWSQELRRLELLLYREVLRLRAAYALSLDEFRGIHVGDELVDRLVGDARPPQADATLTRNLTREADTIAAALDASPVRRLGKLLRLSPFECDVVLLALAPELDLKYEMVIAYLNNDVTRKHPSVDLALRLFEGDRGRLQRDARLFRDGILEPVESTPDRRSGLRLAFTLAPVVTAWLQGLSPFDPVLSPFVHAEENDLVAPAAAAAIDRVADVVKSADVAPVVVLRSEEGHGTRAAARLIRRMGRRALRLDLPPSSEGFPTATLCLAAKLSEAGVILDATAAAHDPSRRTASTLVNALHASAVPIVLVATATTSFHPLVNALPTIQLTLEPPGPAERRALWTAALSRAHLRPGDAAVTDVAHQFRLGPAEIDGAVESLRLLLDEDLDANGRREQLLRVARDQSTADLGMLASRIRCVSSWDDLVLPKVVERRLKEVTRAVRARGTVFGEWGFGARGGHGLMVLFSGASGTGKTLSASVIAHEVGLDLYRIDLSAVVSKYIGETEKNLSRTFAAARSANVVLFFDEADALLGKRSTVKDAHDRYANIEIAYLLQKIEEHDGVVILASNLSKNMDQAFSRRMHYVVEFPRPDVELREDLWRKMFRSDVPRSEDVDFSFLARQFELTGGDIRTVALDAAFMAAGEERAVQMSDLIGAVSRQMQKQGRPLGASDLKQYADGRGQRV